MRVLGLIPARGGSKGVPGKNNKLLNGTPLIGYTIASALASRHISEVVVSTDSEELAQISKELGASVPFIRPATLATDSSPTLDTVIHAIEQLAATGLHFDAVCLLQPTVPFRQAEEIDAAIGKFKKSGADSLISVREIPAKFNPHWAFEPTEGQDFLTIATGETNIVARRQELPKSYYRDGSIYLTNTEIITEKRSLYGQRIAYHENNSTPPINIDTAEDWLKAEEYLNHER